jgi:hypothetical protein
MAHSQAREMVTQGYTATLVAATLTISRSSLYYRKRPRGRTAGAHQQARQFVVAFLAGGGGPSSCAYPS